MTKNEAIEAICKASLNSDTAVVTSYILVAHVADMSEPSNCSRYVVEHSGPMHEMLGLNEFGKQHFVELNKEEMV